MVVDRPTVRRMVRNIVSVGYWRLNPMRGARVLSAPAAMAAPRDELKMRIMKRNARRNASIPEDPAGCGVDLSSAIVEHLL